MEILDGKGIAYTLNINGLNTASILSTLDIVDKCTKSPGSTLSALCEISRNQAIKSNSGVPEGPFLNLKQFDHICLHYPKTATVPRVLHVAVTGYYGSNKLETKVMTIYPYDRYDLLLSDPTDCLSILYEQIGQNNSNIALHIGSYRADIYPRKKKGILVVKMHNPSKLRSKSEHLPGFEEWGTETLNLSTVHDMFINAPGYKIQQVVSCYYSTYTLPHHNDVPAFGTSVINGPLCPIMHHP